MNSTLLKKYETIDQTKVSEKDQKVLAQVKKLTNGFEETDEAKNNVAEKILDQITMLNPDAVKKPQAVAQKVNKAKKVSKAKKTATTSTAKKTGNNITSVAKEIRKAGESWKDAMERAKVVLKERREQVVVQKKTELEKLYALVKTKKELIGFSKSDIERDAVRTAKPRGSRVVTKAGFTSNQHGVNFPNKLGRKYWETRDRHADRLAPNYPKDTPLLAKGGNLDNELLENIKSLTELEMKANNKAYVALQNKNDKYDIIFEPFEKYIYNREDYKDYNNIYQAGVRHLDGTPFYAKGGGVGSKRYFLVKMEDEQAVNKVDKLLQKECGDYEHYEVGNQNGKIYRFDIEDIKKWNEMVESGHKNYKKLIDYGHLFAELDLLSSNNKKVLVWETDTKSWKKNYGTKYAEGGMMAKGGYSDFGYHVINNEVTLKNGKKVFVSKGRYYSTNELGDGRISGVYYESKDMDRLISADEIMFPLDKMADGGMMDNMSIHNSTDFFNTPVYAKGGSTQGYDDREDERIAMKYGKISNKDLDSTHSRRDDARFEERGKMANGGSVNMDKHIWEGWTVGDFIEELEPTFNQIMRGSSWQKPFKTKDEVKEWCMDNQPYYKKNIPDVVNYFWAKVQSNNYYAKGGELEKYKNQGWKKTNRSTQGFDVFSKKIDESTHYAVFDKKGNFLSRSKNNPEQAEMEAYQVMTKHAFADGGEIKKLETSLLNAEKKYRKAILSEQVGIISPEELKREKTKLEDLRAKVNEWYATKPIGKKMADGGSVTQTMIVNMPDGSDIKVETKFGILSKISKRVSLEESKNSVLFYNLPADLQQKINKRLNPDALANGGTMWTKEKVENEIAHYKNLLRNIDKYPDYNKKNVEKIIAEYEEKLAKNEFADGGMFEEPIPMMREVKGKTVNVPVTDEISQSEINHFVDYVYNAYESYEQDGVYEFTKPQVRKAVKKYLAQLQFEYTWGGGDSLDRERVYQFLINPNLEEIKNPRFLDGGMNNLTIQDVSFADGGSVSNERMYNFLQDDLQKLEEAIKNGDMEQVNVFFNYWLGSSGHLKSLETKNNERMYNFLKDDLEKLMVAVEDGDTEQVDIFFSYWGQHLESLKMANGGSLPFMTDPNFGNFQNTGAFSDGGETDGYTLNHNVEFTTSDDDSYLRGNIGGDMMDLIEVENIGDNTYSAIAKSYSVAFEGLKGQELEDEVYNQINEMFATNDDIEVDLESVKIVGEKFELGGAFMTTDLAGHSGGGTGGLNANMPLSGVSGTYYTGLVGETGAMSSGELFMDGGAMAQNQQVINDASQSYVNYYLGEGASQGIYKDGGAIKNQYKGRNSGEIWDNWTKEQREHFLRDHLFAMADDEHSQNYKGEKVTKKVKKYDGSFEYEYVDIDKLINTDNHLDLPFPVSSDVRIHVMSGQYAYGGRTKSTPSMRKLYIEQIAFATNTRTEGVDAFAKEHNLTDSELSNLMTGLGRKMISQSDFITALVGNKNNPKQKEVVAFAKSDKAYKMADGGFAPDVSDGTQFMSGVYANGGSVGDVSGNYYSTTDFVSQNDLMDLAKSTFGQDWESGGDYDYDTEEIKMLIKKLGGGYKIVYVDSEQREKFENAKSKYLPLLKNKSNDGDIFVIPNKKMSDGGFTPDVSDGTQFMSGVYAKGGGIRSKEELKKIFSEKEAIVKNLTPKQIAEMWNKNSYGVKQGISKPITIEEAKKPSMKMYLENLLIENELTEEEQAKYFAKGGFVGTVEFNAGDIVWQKDEKRYAFVMNNYGDPINGSDGEIRLDTSGNTMIFTYDPKTYENTGYNLVKLGEKGDTGKFTPKVLAEMKEAGKRYMDSAKSNKGSQQKENIAYIESVVRRTLDGEFDSMASAKATASSKLKKYIDNEDIDYVALMIKGSRRIVKGSDVLNGANLLKDGGDLSNIAFYVPKRDVISVTLKNGKTINPVNGYWVKKDYQPISGSGSNNVDESFKIGDYVKKTEKQGSIVYGTQGFIYEINKDFSEIKLEDDYGNKNPKSYKLKGFRKLKSKSKNANVSSNAPTSIVKKDSNKLVAPKGYVFVNSGSHRATQQINRGDAKYVSLYSFGGANTSAGTTIMFMTEKDFEKVKDIRGVSPAKNYLPAKSQWFSRHEDKKLDDVFLGIEQKESFGYADGGEMESTDITDDLEKFNIDNLDYYEYEQYNHFLPRLGKAQSLQLLINTVDGDTSQLSPELAELAEKQGSSYADGGFMNNVYANGGGFANDPFYIAFMEKRDKLYAQLKSRVVRAVGIDEAMEFFDYDYSNIAPYKFIERAVQSNLIALDEINKELVDSAIEETREIDNDEDLEEIGSSDFTYYLQHVLDNAGFKVGFVNDRLQRLNEDGSVKEIENNYADGGFMNDVYADGGGVDDEMHKLAKSIVRGTDYKIGLYVPYRTDFYLKDKKGRFGIGSYLVLQDEDNKNEWSVAERKYEKSKGGYYEDIKSGVTQKQAYELVKELINSKYADGGFMNDVYADGGSVETEIHQLKRKLIQQAKSKGISENFGQKEVRMLEDKYPMNYSVGQFDEWVQNFDLNSYADGGMFDDNDGFMKADNNYNYRYPEMEVYVETLDEPIDLTSNVSSRTNEVVIKPLDENIDLSDDNRVRARMTQSNRGSAENFSKINPRAFEFIEELPMPTSNTHKND